MGAIEEIDTAEAATLIVAWRANCWDSARVKFRPGTSSEARIPS